MNRRALAVLGIVVAILVVGYVAFDVGNRDRVPPGPNGNAATDDGSSPGSSGPVSPDASTGAPTGSSSATANANASPAASCVLVSRLVAMRATAADTGFPLPVTWADLGPAGDLFFSLNDVTPEIPLDPPGPAVLRVGLGYFSGGDRIAFTAGSVTLAYDPATGAVTGDVATGYGKNSNRATTDAQPAPFTGVLTRGTGGANGSFTGSIAHHARTFAFRMAVTERTIQVATGPGCTATSPTDAP